MNLHAFLEALEARQFVRALTESEPTFTFKHNLVQQVAYESLLASDRRSLHHAVGETLAQTYPEARRELAEVLASHFEQAGDAARALEYMSLAGEQALQRFATEEAAALYGRAISLAGPMNPDLLLLLQLYQKRGRALELRGDYTTALALYEELEALGRGRGAPNLELAGVIGATSLQAVPTPLFDPVAAMANAERALALATSIGDPAGEAKAYWLMMLVQTRIDARAAVAAGTASLELARRHGLREQQAFTLNDIQGNYQVLGQPERGLQALEEARPIWRDLDNLPMLADNLASTAMLHALIADYGPALQLAHESMAISDRTGNLWGQSYGRIAIGLTHFARGELGPMIQEMTRCIDLAEQARFIYPQVAMRAMLAITYGLAGDLETAGRLADRIRQVEGGSPVPGQVSGAATEAWIAVRLGELDRAEQLLGRISQDVARISEALVDGPVPLVLAQPAYHMARQDYQGALQSIDFFSEAFERFAWRILRAPLLLARGRALVGLGRTTEAREVFHTAQGEMAAQGFDAGLWEVEAALAALREGDGDRQGAAALYRSASARLQTIASGLAPLGLHDRFLRQPHVRLILDKAMSGAV